MANNLETVGIYLRWQVVCIQDFSRHIVAIFFDREDAGAKAARLNKFARGTVRYVVEEVADETEAVNG